MINHALKKLNFDQVNPNLPIWYLPVFFFVCLFVGFFFCLFVCLFLFFYFLCVSSAIFSTCLSRSLTLSSLFRMSQRALYEIFLCILNDLSSLGNKYVQLPDQFGPVDAIYHDVRFLIQS